MRATAKWTNNNVINTVGLNIFYLYTLYIEQQFKTYNNIRYTNGIQKKVFMYPIESVSQSILLYI